jgi:hypothetical protein
MIKTPHSLPPVELRSGENSRSQAGKNMKLAGKSIQARVALTLLALLVGSAIMDAYTITTFTQPPDMGTVIWAAGGQTDTPNYFLGASQGNPSFTGSENWVSGSSINGLIRNSPQSSGKDLILFSPNFQTGNDQGPFTAATGLTQFTVEVKASLPGQSIDLSQLGLTVNGQLGPSLSDLVVSGNNGTSIAGFQINGLAPTDTIRLDERATLNFNGSVASNPGLGYFYFGSVPEPSTISFFVVATLVMKGITYRRKRIGTGHTRVGTSS